METTTKLRRTEIRAILKRHKGSINAVAADLGIAQTNISKWLKGHMTSARIAEAANRKALELLNAEEATGSNGSDPRGAQAVHEGR